MRYATRRAGKTYKHHIFAPTAGARRAIFPKLCMVIEDAEPIKIDDNRFSTQGVLFPTMCTEKFGLND